MSFRPVLVVFVLAGLTAVLAWPALPSMGTFVIGDGGDNYQFLGFQYLANRLIRTSGLPLGTTDYWRYPAGIDFQSAADSMLFVSIGIVLYRFTANPVLVFNLSVLVLVFLNLALTYLAFRHWFNRELALIGAVVYGASFYSLAKLGGHVNLICTAGFPLFVCAVGRILKHNGRVMDFGILAMSGVLLALSSLQYPLILVGALPFAIALQWAFDSNSFAELVKVIWRRKAFTIAAAGVALIIVLPFEGRKIAQFLNGQTILPSDQIVAVPPINFVTPNPYIPTAVGLASNSTRSWIEYSVFIGFVELAALVAALVVLGRTPVSWFLWSVVLVFSAICLGGAVYGVIFPVMPYRGIIEPGRFYVVLYLAVTFLVLLTLQRIGKRWVVLLFGLLVTVERLPRHFYLSPGKPEPALIAAVQSRPTKAVLDLPPYSSWWMGQKYDWFSVFYDRPIVTGYFHWSGDRPESRTLLNKLERMQCYFEPDRAPRRFDSEEAARLTDDIVKSLQENSIRVVVVHKKLFGSLEQCGSAPQHIDALFVPNDRWEVVLDSPASRVLWLR